MHDSSVEIRRETANDLVKRIEALEREIHTIKERNKRVEADKAWETSNTRRALIALITYILATLVLWLISIEEPYLGAFIPTLGYILSTLTIQFGKKLWVSCVWNKSSIPKFRENDSPKAHE